ncbi:DUF4402 domain-containing protein [Novosphingobium sp.]|uniref:DUF4402 domain-containing protein n=1 Tax=Novosphingobium sp. TaxID=1874826 RepID=UPI0035AE0A89
MCAAALLLVASPSPGQDSCRLCFGETAAVPGERALSIEIWADLNFSKLALTGQDGGSAVVDPATGTKRAQGGMIDLGGMTVSGHGRISGMPYREVRLDLPQKVMMTTPDGGTGELNSFTTDLPAHPMLDGNGNLEFNFGAKLVIRSGRGGNFRGRIPISVDYN